MGSVLQQIWPGAKETLAELMSQPITVGALALLLMGLLYHHCLLCYGSRRLLLVPLLLFGLLVLALLRQLPTDVSALALVSTVPVIAFVELMVVAYARHYSPFLTFNSGLLVALLTLIHPGYLLLLPVQLQKSERLGLNTARHHSALLLGLLTTLIIALLLTIPPELSVIKETLREYFMPLGAITSPDGLSPFYFAGIGIIFVGLSVQSYFTQQRSLSRYRWMLLLHIMMMWLMILLFLFYGGQYGYLIGALFFCSSSAHYLLVSSLHTLPLKLALFGGVVLCLVGSIISLS